MKRNKIKTMIIGERQYLKDIMRIIPSNTVIFKKLPGLGATSLEIETQSRNSIIIEPNVPVIQGKCKKYNTKRELLIMGVYEGKTEEQIFDYLYSSVMPKKFIVTPESFKRVKNAIMDISGEDLFKDYFLLFDECERTIQDVSYRADIIIPMMDFFKFEKKAFISATAIMPSDPRFKKEGFTNLLVQPSFYFQQSLHLISTNNIMLSFQQFVRENPREKYFIFFNSTDSIAQLIMDMGIKDEAAIFCAKESRQKLRVNGFTHVYTDLKDFKKFNFFTSRFFSAVDIDYDQIKCDPTIILITDLVNAAHSTIDPLTEAIQIIGRFRRPSNGDFNKEVIHISNYDPLLSKMSKEETIQYVNEKFIGYESIKKFLDASTHRGAVDVLKEMLERSEYKRFINPDESRNYFMQDNIIEKETVNGYYRSCDDLIKAYNSSEHFKLISKIEKYDFTDLDKKKANSTTPLKTVYSVVIPVIKSIEDQENIYLKTIQLERLDKEYPKVMQAYRLLGFDKLKELGFNQTKIREELRKKQENVSAFGLIDFIDQYFKAGEQGSANSFVQRLGRGIKKLGMHHLKASIKLLKKYCRLSERFSVGRDKNKKDVKGYRILEIYNSIKR